MFVFLFQPSIWVVNNFDPEPHEYIYTPKTWQWKNNHSKMYLPLKIVIFHCHTNFPGVYICILHSFLETFFWGETFFFKNSQFESPSINFMIFHWTGWTRSVESHLTPVTFRATVQLRVPEEKPYPHGRHHGKSRCGSFPRDMFWGSMVGEPLKSWNRDKRHGELMLYFPTKMVVQCGTIGRKHQSV